ncbi:hypothetical protein ACTT3R_000567 [Enterobacter ludwigii]|uniref:hypothetical protein n=1 Tax=Enterobacter ludwigii TaxID=299767 RepID=UPI002075100A|nr:hypothetical protein [Enterobacter ludwigii]MCM7267604.1 hypothetical protein [Enterobacter ludwigii]
MKLPITAAIISVSLIISASILNINGIHSVLTESTKSPDTNILSVEGGSVRLGKVDAERETVNILVYIDANNAKLFHIGSESIESLKATETAQTKPIINIRNMPPSEALPEFRKQLTDFVALVNEQKSGKEKITIENLTSTAGFAVRVNSYITYDSALQGKFAMLTDEEEISIPKDKHILPEVTSVIKKVVGATENAHKINTFM